MMVASYVDMLITSVPELLIFHLTLSDDWTDSLGGGRVITHSIENVHALLWLE